jgi:hypothetical protein
MLYRDKKVVGGVRFCAPSFDTLVVGYPAASKINF